MRSVVDESQRCFFSIIIVVFIVVIILFDVFSSFFPVRLLPLIINDEVGTGGVSDLRLGMRSVVDDSHRCFFSIIVIVVVIVIIIIIIICFFFYFGC